MSIDTARAKSLFLAASDLTSPANRADYLDRECGADAELRARVEALLRANDQALKLPEGANDPTSAHAASYPPPTKDCVDPSASVGAILAGKYKLIQEIGEGGMGSVFMAQQTEPVRRVVAVKVIKAGMDSRAVLARFEAERQALAIMDHPNIAKVLDAGTTEGGRPFFVMELVKGTPITQYCDERKLTPRQRLELFVPVCQAIQHAHQKGIIHRDIKPTNVLVAMFDDRLVPKVIDFGVAKATGSTLTDKTLMTGFGAVVGTPEYMSPEQASLNNLDIDTRSDVYSLGVLLYELLTGSTPVDRKSLGNAALLEILRIVREVDAPRPSAKLSTIDTLPSVAANRGIEPGKLSKLMKGELDWVLLKALEKDRSRRYETANGLARDIERYLADEVVEARPPSAGYRLKKFVRRHKVKVLAVVAAAVVFVSVTATLVIGAFYAEARRARLTAERLKESAVIAQKSAQKEKLVAQQAAYESKQSKERVRQVFYAADIQLARTHWEANRPVKMRELLEQHIPATGERDLRGFEWHYLWHLANSAQRTLRGHTQPIDTLAFAGGALLSGDVEYQYRTAGTLRKWPNGRMEGATKLFTQLVSPTRAGYYPGIRSLDVLPDGTRCALVDDGVVRVLNVEYGEQVRLLDDFSGEPQAVALLSHRMANIWPSEIATAKSPSGTLIRAKRRRRSENTRCQSSALLTRPTVHVWSQEAAIARRPPGVNCSMANFGSGT
jgi:eukaryotic-like serine/threonine-protein kinase